MPVGCKLSEDDLKKIETCRNLSGLYVKLYISILVNFLHYLFVYIYIFVHILHLYILVYIYIFVFMCACCQYLVILTL